MPGLFRFDFYPRDWITGTRGLSLEARGAYIDILAAMYDHGGPIRHDEKFLCGLLSIKNPRTLRRVLAELIDAEKIKVENALIFNSRASVEIDGYRTRHQQRSGAGKKGGRPAGREQGIGQSSGDDRANIGQSSGKGMPKLSPDNVENQDVDKSKSPSPSPSPSNNNRVVVAPTEKSLPSGAKKYAYVGTVVRLTVEHFDEWEKAYYGIPDLMAELRAIDGWCVEHWREGSTEWKGWYRRVSNMLNNKHQEMLANRKSDPAAEYYAEIDRGTLF